MKTKRLVSVIIILIMVLSFTPTINAFASSDSTIVLACSDFQNENGNAEGKVFVQKMLNVISSKGITSAYGFLCCGDYDYEYTDTKGGVDALKEATVNFVTGESVFTQGNHDSGIGTNGMSPSGNCDPENGKYGVFNINEDDYMWNNSDEARIKSTAQNLIEYLNEKIEAKYDKPIFVLSHLPLHYSMRTKNDGDGKHANYIFNALNAAGEKGLNIIFMYGHDHSNGWDDYLGGAAVYLKKGNSILIAQNSQTNFKEETLNFTYTNPGFIGYYRDLNTGVDATLTMTTWEITSDKVIAVRYDTNGFHNMKSCGVRNEYKNESGYGPNTTVYTSPQTINLTKVTDTAPIPDIISRPGSGKNSGYIYKRVTKAEDIKDGSQYLLVYNSNEDYIMTPSVVTKSNQSGERTGYDIIKYKDFGANKWIDSLNIHLWKFTKSGESWKIGTTSGFMDFESTSAQSASGKLTSSGELITVGGTADMFTLTGTDGYSLNYNSRGVINGYTSNPAGFYIYEYTEETYKNPENEIFDGMFYSDDYTVTDEGDNVNTFVVEIDTSSDTLQIVTGVPNDETPLKPGAQQTTTGHAQAAEAHGKNVVAAINADFFNINNTNLIQPCGVTIKDGVKLSDYTSATGNRSYFFGIKKDGTPIIGDKAIFDSVETDLDQAVGGGPWLVKDGEVIETVDSRHPRTAIGIKTDGSIIMVVADGRSNASAGLTFIELAYYMKSLGAVEALNLDGGGSSAMVVENASTAALEIKNEPSDGNERPVGNTLLVLKHSYDNVCDEACECGYTRIAPHDYKKTYSDTEHWKECSLCHKAIENSPHLFDNVCDEDCVCGYTRTAEHNTSLKFDNNNHWTECSLCHEKTNVSGHYYDDVCDNKCECGYSRNAPHDFKANYSDSKHWKECSICSTRRGEAPHSFDNNCDTSCNCGYIRNPLHNYQKKYNSVEHWQQCSICSDKKNTEKHKFDTACDASCDGCSFTRSTQHSYDNSFDSYCNICKSERTPPNTATKVFFDVKTGSWYKKYVDYAVAYGMFTGTSSVHFSPDTSMTRAQFVKVLANLSGVKMSNNVTSGFNDVPSGKWYTGAIKWAADNGIVSGMGAGRFEPNTQIDRQQMCVMLVNYVEKYQKQSLKKIKVYSGFSDEELIARWAEDAIVKCFESGLVSGTGNNCFSPKNVATRAQGATIFTNFHKEYIA